MNESTLFGVNEKLLTMHLERNIRSLANRIHSSNPSNKSTPVHNPTQSVATLIVMIAVLTIIILFCCFSAPGIRGLCKKYIFRSCPYDDPEVDNASTSAPQSAATPTVILLPYGRMLVVDRTVFSQLHADQSGIDLLELSANLIRRSQNVPSQITGSTPSILDSDNTSKGLTPTSISFDPPAYEDIFGMRDLDLPPSYSEVSLMLKNQKNWGECIELGEISRPVENSNERTINVDESDVCVDINSEAVRENEDTV